MLVYLYGKIGRYAVSLQEHHGIPQFPFVIKALADSSGHTLADTFYVSQALRFFLYHAKGLVTEHGYYPFSKCLSYAFDSTRSQVPFHSIRILGFYALRFYYFILLTIDIMLCLLTGKTEIFTFRNIRKASHKSQHIGAVFSGKLKYGITVLVVSVYYIVNASLNLYCHYA